ncbi:hypothetical protein HZ326_4610 [Fusarium oxysporum f. sp. albedinis]|nr:hypothetical protein HZ326_4610 [Fusarium oxysporum f. sp. albedinis]
MCSESWDLGAGVLVGGTTARRFWPTLPRWRSQCMTFAFTMAHGSYRARKWFRQLPAQFEFRRHKTFEELCLRELLLAEAAIRGELSSIVWRLAGGSDLLLAEEKEGACLDASGLLMESKKLCRFVWSAATLISMTLWDISGVRCHASWAPVSP